MKDKERMKILLDCAGTEYGGRAESTINGLDGNTFLSRIGAQYTEYLTDRISIENIIRRMGSILCESGWFIPINYEYYTNDIESDLFIGSCAERMKMVKDFQINLVVRLHVCALNHDGITIGYVNNNSERIVVELAEEFSNCEIFENIEVVKCNVSDSELLHREIAQELRAIPEMGLSVNLGLHRDGEFVKYLSSVEGEEWLIGCLSRFFDKVSERK